MIYDCFTFNNELDVLELRLNELNNIVDRHVLVESTQTFTGMSKPLHYQINKARFKKFAHKIIHIIVEDMDLAVPVTQLKYFDLKNFQRSHIDTWSREVHQRNAIKRGLAECRLKDIILIGDIDEIPRAQVIKSTTYNKQLVGFEQDNFNYFINCKGVEKWVGTKGGSFQLLKNMDPEEVRGSQEFLLVKNGGWHFSFLGGYEAITDKIKSFSHQEHNSKKNQDQELIKLNMENGLDIFGRPFKYNFISIDSSYPKYLLNNLSKYKNYIHAQKKVDRNTLMLRSELFNARSALYWKELELQEVIKTMNHYQQLYRNYVKMYPFPYILARIQGMLKTIKERFL
jgi:beta-1,4-mannosyl-glycoprotein beta-1,4-N-acetylglucosaminyltransferase